MHFQGVAKGDVEEKCQPDCLLGENGWWRREYAVGWIIHGHRLPDGQVFRQEESSSGSTSV